MTEENIKQDPRIGRAYQQAQNLCSEPKEATDRCIGLRQDRQSAKALLKDCIFANQERAQHLQILFNLLPEQLSPEQDYALYQLLKVARAP